MKIILDAGQMERKKEAHAYLKEQLRFPEYYGQNLDALYDCLTEMEDVQVEFIHAQEAGGYFEKVLRVFRHAAGQNPGLTLEPSRGQNV